MWQRTTPSRSTARLRGLPSSGMVAGATAIVLGWPALLACWVIGDEEE
jgi:hypothetical protein